MLTKQILHQMLKKVPAERTSLSEVLQNRDLRARLENPLNGEIFLLLVMATLICAFCTCIGHWSDIYRCDKDTVC